MKKVIYIAGGCFWGIQGYYKKVKGVLETESGYANGHTSEATYNTLKESGHAEAVKIVYDPAILSLEEIVLRLFSIINPTMLNRQGFDVGRQYRSGIYYVDEADVAVIKKVFEYEKKFYQNIVVAIEELDHFITAEEYHQDYLEKNPRGYCHVNLAKADEPIFEEGYFQPENKELEENLDELSYAVMRENATERPGTFRFPDLRGIYVDKITGEPLFSWKDKYDAGCGWPSFTKSIMTDKVAYLEDKSHGMTRTEVRSASGDNHLGHVFPDGPMDKGGLRYCINGAALRFIPYDLMDEEGYDDYKVFC